MKVSLHICESPEAPGLCWIGPAARIRTVFSARHGRQCTQSSVPIPVNQKSEGHRPRPTLQQAVKTFKKACPGLYPSLLKE
eukprot:55289-Eustigmatos_ZCMA.PRE.1